LAAVLKVLKPSVFSDEAQVDSLLKSLDKNGDGCVDYEEFVAWTQGGAHSNLALKALALDVGTAPLTTHKCLPSYLFSLIDKNEDGIIDESEWDEWVEMAGEICEEMASLEELDFETVKAFNVTGNNDGEDDEEDETEPGPLDKLKFVRWMLSLHNASGDETAEMIFMKGTRAGKVLACQRKVKEAPLQAILEALEKKMGSTTSAIEWLNFLKKKGRLENYGEEEEEDDDD